MWSGIIRVQATLACEPPHRNMFDDRRMIPGCTSGVMVEALAVHAPQRGLMEHRHGGPSGVPTQCWVGASCPRVFSRDGACCYACSDGHCASPLQHKWMGRNPSELIGIRD